MLFLGQNDLCMSMGLYEKYQFPDMYTSPELKEATDALKAAAKKNNVILGLFLFGTDRVAEFKSHTYARWAPSSCWKLRTRFLPQFPAPTTAVPIGPLGADG